MNSDTLLPALIEGDRVTLRRWRVADAEVLGAIVTESLEHLRPWMGWTAPEPLTLEQREGMLAGREREWLEGGDVMLGVFLAGRAVGSCGLHRRIGPDRLELGYWIHPAFTRQGLATEVARLLTAAACSVPGIERIEIHHDKANEASAGIPVKLGYSFVGEIPDTREAAAEVGIECVWRIQRETWENSED